MATRNPEDALVPLFKNFAVKNEAKSAKEGRPIFDDLEVVELRFAGSRNMSVHPATEISFWRVDPDTGEQVPVTYAERFAKQYRQFKEMSVQTKSGTPLSHAPFLTVGRQAELRALNIYTVEALAHIDGQELKNLGTYGRDLKNKAEEYLVEARSNAPNTALAAELDAIKAQNLALKDDVERLKLKQVDEVKDAGDTFDNMSLDQLRDFITTNTGHAPHGSLNRKTLVRMANEAQQTKAA